MREMITMSAKELDRLTVLERISRKEVSQQQAAKILEISDRQVRNLLKKLKTGGRSAIASKSRGKPSNRQISPATKEKVVALMHEKYEGFGPTFIQEKLEELDGIRLSTETIRSWMLAANLWSPKVRRIKVHLPRDRRPCFGELIQGDGSHHRWFGEDLPMANLTVLIDDATGILTALYFSETETLVGYFQALEQHLGRYGRPRAIYTDRHAVFEARDGKGETQMQRALKELDIQLILALSPQAKGRVERANRTLQDRLVKEMALRGIKTIEEANKFANTFMEIWNKKFSKEPMSSFDAHRSLEGYDLPRILSRKETRTLLVDLSFQFNGDFYSVQGLSDPRRNQGRKIELRLSKEGDLRAFLDDAEVQIVKGCRMVEPVSRKQTKATRSRANGYRWRETSRWLFRKPPREEDWDRRFVV
jgi:transposase